MNTNIKNKIASSWGMGVLVAFGLLTSCSDFLEEHTPQGTLSEEQVKSPENAENMVISAYAIFTTAEDINSSFSMWNFDVRSDDAYKGGNGTSDGDVFHQLEIQQGVLTTNWNINDMWERLYKCISRVNSAIALLNTCDDMTADQATTKFYAEANKWFFFTPLHDVNIADIQVSRSMRAVLSSPYLRNQPGEHQQICIF